jgi:DNA polymerase-1
VFNPRDDGAGYDPEGVVSKFGVRPEQVVDVLALMGDSIDNVKGVPGIGEKGARELIGAHGTLDALLANAAQLPQKRYREALLAHVDAAKASRELLRIRTDVDVPFDPGRFKYTGAKRERCYELFSRLGFRSLLPDYAPTAATVEKHYGLVSTTEELSRLATTIAAVPEIGLHLLTSEAGPMRAEIVGVAVSTGPRAASYVPVGRQGGGLLDPASDFLPLDEILEAFKPTLESERIRKVGHDLKTATSLLARQGITLRGLGFDTMIGSYLIDPTRSAHTLEDTSLEHLGYKALTEEDVCGAGSRTPFWQHPPETLRDFACERADLPLQLVPIIAGRLDSGRRLRRSGRRSSVRSCPCWLRWNRRACAWTPRFCARSPSASSASWTA